MSKTILSISRYMYINKYDGLHYLSVQHKIAYDYSLVFKKPYINPNIRRSSGLITEFGAIIPAIIYNVFMTGNFPVNLNTNRHRSIHVLDKFVIDNYADNYYIFNDCFVISQDIKSLTKF